MRNPTRTFAAATVAALLAAAGCTSSTEPFRDPGTLAAADAFDRIADSLSTAGAEPRLSTSYREVARMVRRGPTLSSVVVSVDGVPAEYLATAVSFDQNYCPPGAVCALAFVYWPPLNSVIAWQRSDPRRIMQLTADGDAPIGTTPGYTYTGPLFRRTALVYLDGAGGVYVGARGAQSIKATPSDEPCAAPTAPLGASYVMPPIQCTRATFDVSFDATVQPPSFDLRGSTASGTHTVAMTAQTVSGTRLFGPTCSGGCIGDTPLMRPPIAIDANSSVLQPALRAIATAAAHAPVDVP
jgi:hypothetical protein